MLLPAVPRGDEAPPPSGQIVITRVYLLRHAQTIWNAERRYQGTLNPPLSERGGAEAGALRDALRSVPLRAVYSSPLARAMETAILIAEAHGLPVVAHEGLREIGVGEWEGLLMDEIEVRYAEVLRNWWDRPHLTRIPGGETLDELRDRGVRAMGEIRRSVLDGAAAVVAHGGVNKTIIFTALGAPLASYWRIRQANACINVLDYDGDRQRVLILNATAHLGQRPGAILSGRLDSSQPQGAERAIRSEEFASPETW